MMGQVKYEGKGYQLMKVRVNRFLGGERGVNRLIKRKG
jgi:hypothetical protein